MLETGDDAGRRHGRRRDGAKSSRNTAQLTPEDRAAMAAYIKSLPPVEGPKKPETEITSFETARARARCARRVSGAHHRSRESIR